MICKVNLVTFLQRSLLTCGNQAKRRIPAADVRVIIVARRAWIGLVKNLPRSSPNKFFSYFVTRKFMDASWSKMPSMNLFKS